MRDRVDFDLVKKPDLVWIVRKFFQYNYILSLAFSFTIILIRAYIIQHQDLKVPLQQSYGDITPDIKAFI